MSGDGSGGGGGNGNDDGLAARRGVDDAVVYQPAEDSGLLAEAAVAEAHGRVLEVGTGSGWVAERIAEERGLDVVGGDLNPHAARQARERGVEAVVADLLSPFRADAFDTVCFNPPYLPTDPDNGWDDWMEHALSGGESGRELIEPFLADVGRALAPDGVVLLLVSSLTGYDEVLDAADEAGFAAEPVVEESFPFETLTVLALRRA
ncbi:methyltransferase domain-containing protein [Halorubrum sp. Atlit-8R]|uniref:HemK2/MTQ2 family protein methyltransferase n=1 Tax=unclassified Halorubrum TaxID=2642239 RepID=UPI000EF1898E|nr:MULTISPECIES: HemK2/MTQ2 family protein methyltransferase [unclassified Halorubrum]RLM63142.1 methyltransferase domain-containing protein [Halorubrum sp. Atlit-9R]RLM82044.1 methyltransferase domain-containing protein [Halorubrum sp. Atlit-8R]